MAETNTSAERPGLGVATLVAARELRGHSAAITSVDPGVGIDEKDDAAVDNDPVDDAAADDAAVDPADGAPSSSVPPSPASSTTSMGVRRRVLFTSSLDLDSESLTKVFRQRKAPDIPTALLGGGCGRISAAMLEGRA